MKTPGKLLRSYIMFSALSEILLSCSVYDKAKPFELTVEDPLGYQKVIHFEVENEHPLIYRKIESFKITDENPLAYKLMGYKKDQQYELPEQDIKSYIQKHNDPIRPQRALGAMVGSGFLGSDKSAAVGAATGYSGFGFYKAATGSTNEIFKGQVSFGKPVVTTTKEEGVFIPASIVKNGNAYIVRFAVSFRKNALSYTIKL